MARSTAVTALLLAVRSTTAAAASHRCDQAPPGICGGKVQTRQSFTWCSGVGVVGEETVGLFLKTLARSDDNKILDVERALVR